MENLPIFMNLKDRPALVVGGGTVAARKAELLLLAGASVTVIAPRVRNEMRRMIDTGRVVWREQVFGPGLVRGFRIVIAATDNEAVNRLVFEECERHAIPVNVADQPELCSFILPSIVERGPLTLALSTGGRSPILARLLKARLEALIPAGFGHLTELLGRYRGAVKRRFAVQEARRHFWERMLDGPLVQLATSGRIAQAERLIEEALEAGQPAALGEVWLIGAGPGDADLLTLKALRLLQQADVVVHDRLVPEAIVNLARREAERIDVGKCMNRHTLPQEEINRLLVDLAKQGKRVARLKGGDPFIFGRGGEEMEAVIEAGIPCLAVPGITAAAGCAAAAGMPLTHRDHAQSVRFVTGHTKKDDMGLDWRALVAEGQTLVFYMGLANVERICERLMAHGMRPDMPAAIVERGTLPDQRVFEGTLASLPEVARRTEPRSPSLIVVGEVVRLRERLGFVESTSASAADLSLFAA
ncbi:siroheme synthase CysG [Thiofaba sp. EF100]|uniref:siroheme synthase CysG n=1 Tax=Thiofaba sp. EF100 TaxID=3121274 RepID=UPI00322171D1